MAHTFITTTTSLLLLLLLLTTTTTVTSNLRELELMKSTLRSHGYTLFCNSISTSDLQLQFLSSTSAAVNFTDSGDTPTTDYYTIFAAADSYVYALDIASDGAAYVSTLRYHVIPNRRLTHAQLRNLKTPFLETLLPHFSISVNNGGLDGVVWVDGVKISDPDLYVGSRIVVHGIDGMLVTGIVKNEDLEDNVAAQPSEEHIPLPGPGMSPVAGTGYGKDGGDRVKKTRKEKHHRHHHSRKNRGVRNPKGGSHNHKEEL